MKPKVIIFVEGGVVQDVSTNIPELSVRLHDIDLKRSGEEFEHDFPCEYVGPSNFGELPEDAP